ncbi:MAG: beta-ketoacyl-[acyl-carrier-protein] synthase family protein [Desulfobulbaceae bacterium]|nr:beta-ketoacyl-[acyl-carrier-protein] synthase family protein [Desulfobulbaceae bacterium]HIJ78956.1 beta-ketoacyl-[acyl-carrier-protein] synthase family protein [Deltaproteobacteria bacterium]
MKNQRSSRRVVVTGMGIVSCLGLSRAEVRESLKTGKCGILLDHERKTLGFRSGLSGRIKGFSAERQLDRKYRKTLPEFGWWAWDAVCQALEQAGVDPESLAGDTRAGLIFGNDSSVVTGVEQCEVLRAAGETRGIGSGHIFRLLTSTITLNLCTKLKLHGSSWSISSACASGAMAIGQAAELIASGKQDRVICGGAQEISWQSMCSFDAINAFSRREDEPEKSSRPFDQGRDGLVPSGGAAVVFLEEQGQARARGAKILAEICGYDTSSDGHHISAPSGEGLLRAMAGAINDANLSPDDIDLVMAHATSTPMGDSHEAKAIAGLFEIENERQGPVVAAVKSLTGHEFWMAGASQVVYGLLMSRAGFVVGHPNLDNPDSAAAGLNIPRNTMDFSPKYILCNAAGFGGVNGCLVVKASI